MLHLSRRQKGQSSRPVSSPLLVGTVLHQPCVHIHKWRPFGPVSVPFSWGTVLHPSTATAQRFQSIVSVPFSWGTVLHPARAALVGVPSCFSPLLVGDGVASMLRRETGNVVEFQSPSRGGRCCIPAFGAVTTSRFQSLLVGDGVASADGSDRSRGPFARFSPPSRGGRCCIFIDARGRPMSY